ncbi:retropepsin-like aspartic protease [Frateuria aurantia]
MRALLWAGLLLAEPAAAVEQTVDAIELGDPQGVVVAMAHGDRQALLEVVAHPQDEFERRLAQVALLRVGGDLDAASARLQRCEQVLPVDQPMRALCGVLIAGNFFMQRRMADWQQKLEWIRRTYYPLLARDNPGRQPTLRDAEGVDFLPGKLWPRPQQQWDQARVELPYLTQAERSGVESRLPSMVVVSIKGHRYHALVDTGAGFDTIDPDVAKILGLTPAASYRKLSDASGTVLPAPIAVLPELKLGGVTIRHWPVSVARTPVPIVIGQPMLRWLGWVALGADGLSLQRDGGARCQRPMVLAASTDGSVSHLLYALTVDGKAQLALIDTGGGFEIQGVKALLPGLKGRPKRQRMVYAGGTQWVDSYPIQAAVDLGDGVHTLKFQVVDQAFALVPYALGAGLLKHHTLIMDFRRHMLCVEPRVSQ